MLRVRPQEHSHPRGKRDCHEAIKWAVPLTYTNIKSQKIAVPPTPPTPVVTAALTAQSPGLCSGSQH